MKYLLLLLCACSEFSEQQVDLVYTKSTSDWNICPEITGDKTEYQIHLELSKSNIDTKQVSLDGSVSDVKPGLITHPILFLRSPMMNANIDSAMVFIHPHLQEQVSTINRNDLITVHGKVDGQCEVGSFDEIHINIIAEKIDIIRRRK